MRTLVSVSVSFLASFYLLRTAHAQERNLPFTDLSIEQLVAEGVRSRAIWNTPEQRLALSLQQARNELNRALPPIQERLAPESPAAVEFARVTQTLMGVLDTALSDAPPHPRFAYRLRPRQVAELVEFLNRTCPKQNPLRFDVGEVEQVMSFQNSDLRHTFRGALNFTDPTWHGAAKVDLTNNAIRFSVDSVANLTHGLIAVFDWNTGAFIEASVVLPNVIPRPRTPAERTQRWVSSWVTEPPPEEIAWVCPFPPRVTR